jgi:erythromycin esterase-like protein
LRGTSSPEEDAALSARLYDVGDHVRFKIFEKLRQTRYRDAKTFFWMHNWHAMKKSTAVGMNGAHMPSLGMRLAKRYGKRLVSIGNLVPCVPEWCTDPADSVELPFREKFGGKPGVVDFRDRAAVRALKADTPGQLIPNLHAKSSGMGFTDVVLSDQFDGVIYLPSSGTTFKRK